MATLGSVLTNYSTRTLEFYLEGTLVVWQDVSLTEVQPVQPHSLRRMTTTEAIASCFCLEVVAAENSPIDQPDMELTTLLDLYVDMFQKPAGLPPSCLQDHAIHLNSGAQLVNVKPYRYPYF